LQGDNGTARSGNEAAAYPITTPSGRVVLPPKGYYWRFSRDTLERALADDRVYFGRNGDGMPIIKRFLTEVQDGIVPRKLWMASEVGSNMSAKRDHLRKMFPDLPAFATPKPEGLLERVLHIASNPGEIVLDCFAGSGSTAAVAHKTGRRWVTSEILEETVETYTRPRLRKVVDGEDNGGITKQQDWSGGGGFRCLAVGPSMYEVADNGTPLLADWATNGRFSRGVAAQLDFDFKYGGAPFCGHRGRMRLVVLDGAVGPEEIRTLVAALGDDERLTVVAKVVLPGAEEMLGSLSKGSRIRKAPRDVLADGSRKARRRERTAP